MRVWFLNAVMLLLHTTRIRFFLLFVFLLYMRMFDQNDTHFYDEGALHNKAVIRYNKVVIFTSRKRDFQQ